MHGRSRRGGRCGSALALAFVLAAALAACRGRVSPPESDGGWTGDGSLAEGGVPARPDGGLGDGGDPTDGGPVADAGSPPVSSACHLRLGPSPLSFGLVTLGESRTLDLDLHAAGAAPCVLTDLRIEGETAFTLVRPAEALRLEPGRHRRLSIRFAPERREARYEGELRLVVEGSPFVRVVPLTGRARWPEVVVSPERVDFEQVRLECSQWSYSEANVCAYVTGPLPVTLTGVSLEGDGAFFLRSVPIDPDGGGIEVPAGVQLCLRVAYRPEHVGPAAARLRFEFTELREPLEVTLAGDALLPDPRHEFFVQRGSPPYDLLFVVDEGPTMADKQAGLAVALGNLFWQVDHACFDPHLAVVGADPSDGGVLRPLDGTRPRVVDHHTPDASAVLRANAELDTREDAVGAGLAASVQALTLAGEPGSPNAGFLREDAYLFVYIVSDRDDASPDTPAAYVERLVDLKAGRRGLVGLAAITGGAEGCSGPQGSALAAPRYQQAVHAARGGAWPICEPGWGWSLAPQVSWYHCPEQRFVLARVPRPETVRVTVTRPDGTAYSETRFTLEDWSTLVFETDAVPGAGALIDVSYIEEC